MCAKCLRDGVTEPSNVVTKTFVVEDIGPPPSDIDLDTIDLTPDNEIDAMWNTPNRKPKKKVCLVTKSVLKREQENGM